MVERTTHRRSRREFLTWLGKGTIRTSLFAFANGCAFTIQDRRVQESRQRTEEEIARQREQGDGLKVQYFTREIIAAGARITSQTEFEDIVAIVTGWLAGDALGGYLLRNKSELVNRVAGSVGMTGGKVLDYISTYTAIKQTSDPRFEEYGLGHPT